jgi:hypothetical protein
MGIAVISPVMDRLSFLFALLVCAADAAVAQTHADLARCRAITDDARRLACYDAIEPLGSSRLSKYEVVGLADFQEFALGYRGRFVEVRGTLRFVDEYATLGLDAGDAAAIPVELENLSRQELRTIRDACPESCEATVQGRAAPLRFTTGIRADVVVVH